MLYKKAEEAPLGSEKEKQALRELQIFYDTFHSHDRIRDGFISARKSIVFAKKRQIAKEAEEG